MLGEEYLLIHSLLPIPPEISSKTLVSLGNSSFTCLAIKLINLSLGGHGGSARIIEDSSMATEWWPS